MDALEEPYWLDCVAPGAWEAVEISRDGRVIARLPYVVRKLYGVTALTVPRLTPWLGPWIAPSTANTQNSLARSMSFCASWSGSCRKLIAYLLDALPSSPIYMP